MKAFSTVSNCAKAYLRFLKSLVAAIYLFHLFFILLAHIYPPFTRKRIVSLSFGRDVRTPLVVAISEVSRLPIFHIKMGRSH